MGEFLWECWQKDLLLVLGPRYLQTSGVSDVSDVSDICKYLVPPTRAGLLVNQYLDFICSFVPVVSFLLENTIWEQ